jgi:hypothetical protein
MWHVSMKSSKLEDNSLHLTSRIFVAREYWSLSIYESFTVKNKPQILHLITVEYCASVLHRNCVVIPCDCLAIQVHDYASFFKKISFHCQWSFHMYLMTQNCHPHENYQLLYSRWLYCCYQFWWVGLRYMSQEWCCCWHQYQIALWADDIHCQPWPRGLLPTANSVVG